MYAKLYAVSHKKDSLSLALFISQIFSSLLDVTIKFGFCDFHQTKCNICSTSLVNVALFSMLYSVNKSFL